MNRKYNLKLDLQFRCNNSTMKFNQFDNNTSDFFMRITNGGNLVDIEKAIVVLAIIKPSGKVASQFVEVENGLVYADLKPNMRDEIGIYTAQAMLILEDERVVTDVISYEVEEDKIFSLLNDTVGTSEEFTLLTDMLSRLSAIEISEEQRVINEAERILSEENRKIEEAKRVEAELIRQHEEADRAKYDATRESNENIRKQNESIRLANETNRIDEETKRVEEEANRVEAEQLRKDNYNFMTEDEERRRLEANAHKEAEVLRVQAETNRVNEEAKRRTTEQARVSAENTRVSNENTRKTNEEARQNNETHRVEAETQRQNRYNSFIADAEANANNFENYTNSAKVKEEERKSNELNRKSQEDRRVSNEVERISNENARKANEVAREKNETSRQNIFENKVDEVDKKIVEINTTKDNFISSINTKVDNKISEIDKSKSDMTNTVSNKVNEVENRFNALTSKQQQDAEVIDARDGETSLKARLDRDIEKAKQVYVNVEGSHISTDSSVGYLKDVEILGNTIQDASNLADIRSVGDKVEGQELYEIPVLSRGKNLFNIDNISSNIVSKSNDTYEIHPYTPVNLYNKGIFKAVKNVQYTVSYKAKVGTATNFRADFVYTDGSYQQCSLCNSTTEFIEITATSNRDKQLDYIRFNWTNAGTVYIKNIQIEEGTVATPYEPYQEDKLTILSPVQLEKVGDVRDRIIEKDGVGGVEKGVVDFSKTPKNWDTRPNDSGLLTFECRISEPYGDVSGNKLQIICSKLVGKDYNTIYNNPSMEGIGVKYYNNNLVVRINISSTKLISQDINGITKYLDDAILKTSYNTPTFIPLPHSQQIRLRTFANKTNISFGCEIEGTIKAQVPKSIGATVNTHTEQINNLNKELDRVKKLEESTVSTVTTESDFTTVKATSNGYFEDVKLEGKTLVNLYNPISINPSPIGWNSMRIDATRFEMGKEYTFGINNLPSGFRYVITTVDDVYLFQYITSTCIKFKMVDTKENYLVLHLNEPNMSSLTLEQMENLQVTILEGDHTQNPPNGHIEGLKSVGQSATTSEDGADEIVVSSVNENLFDVESFINFGLKQSGKFKFPISLEKNTTYTFSDDVGLWNASDVYIDLKNKNDMLVYDLINPNLANRKQITFTTDSVGGYYFETYANNIPRMLNITTNFMLNKGTTPKPYTPHKQDKKRLLYYNTETQAWEKPILREWDSIEKHSDGKYYYHVRSKEGDYVEGDESLNDCITDLTVSVKKLAEEKVYECTNIDLITYANKTNYIVNCGVIVPKTTLKVHNNISNVVSLLQKKVSLLESNVTSYMITQNRLMLASRYNADTVSFKVDVATLRNSFEYDNDLYELILNNILVGKDNYNREYIENLIRFYWMDFVISDEMYSTLFEIIEEQHNPKIEEETPLI